MKRNTTAWITAAFVIALGSAACAKKETARGPVVDPKLLEPSGNAASKPAPTTPPTGIGGGPSTMGPNEPTESAPTAPADDSVNLPEDPYAPKTEGDKSKPGSDKGKSGGKKYEPETGATHPAELK